MSMPTSIPFVFFGTPDVGAKTLSCLIEAGYIPKLVVTAPDRPKGRGLALTPTPVKELSLARGMPCLTPEKLDDAALDAIKKSCAAYAVVVAYGKILPEKLLGEFPKGVLNVHYSLLPKYRGASPVEAALLSGDTLTGVTIQRMVYKLDAGDIVSQSTTGIEDSETAIELRARLITLGADLLVSTLPDYLSGNITPKPQDETEATHCGKIQKDDRELSLRENGLANWRRYRAYAEGPGTHFYALRGDTKLRIKIRKAIFENGVFAPTRVVPEGKQEQDFSAFRESGVTLL